MRRARRSAKRYPSITAAQPSSAERAAGDTQQHYQTLAADYAVRLWMRVPEVRERVTDLDFAGALCELLRPHLLQTESRQLDRHIRLAGSMERDDGVSSDCFTIAGFCLDLNPRQYAGFTDWVDQLAPKLSKRLARKIYTDLLHFEDEDDEQFAFIRPLARCVRVLSRVLQLSEHECALLEYLLTLREVPALQRMFSECSCSRRDYPALLAAALCSPESAVREMLDANARLIRLQLIEIDEDGNNLSDWGGVGESLLRLRTSNVVDEQSMLEQLLQPLPAAQWRLADFPHLAAQGELIASTLRNAAACGQPGVNVLLYGAPGTGKTAFAASLAAAAGLQAYTVRSSAADGSGLARNGRLGAYALAQEALAQRRDCVLIFDEIEDVFGGDDALPFWLLGRARSMREKGHMHRVLEGNPVPALWITNDAESMDPACKRRFLLPLAFPTPPQAVRRRVVDAHLGAYLRDDRSGLLERLAADESLQPAQFDSARRLIELNPQCAAAEIIVAGIGAQRELLHGARLPRRRQRTMHVDTAFLNVSGALEPERVIAALALHGSGRLCLYGVPGTGKTEFVYHLAERLGRQLLVRRGSDLRGPYVGETEHNLAAAFAAADPAHNVLLFDEIDGFLGDRRTAAHRWELNEVNELLQQIEDYPGIFVATTNLLDQLDGAALRRFDFKLEFLPLDAEQRQRLFAREVYGDADAELPETVVRHLGALDGLTTGDYANVVRQQTLLGETANAAHFLARLMAELKARQVN